MDVQEAYDQWAEQYDTNQNKTRDMEAMALREALNQFHFGRVLEIGCGTGKNTGFLLSVSGEVLAVDLSSEMLAMARAKISSANVRFVQADINMDWDFAEGPFDLVTFSLVLEHISDLEPVFKKVYSILKPGGRVYIGELHPFKQYAGSKARFETEDGTRVVTCFNHHVSDFTTLSKKAGFEIDNINEYFDEDDRQNIPRIFTLVLRK